MSKFVWHDLMTPDMNAAEQFYAKVIGWNVVGAGMPDGNYRVCNAGSVGVGGLMGFRPGDDKSVSPFWSGYIYTPDVGVAAQRAVALGGKIFREPTVVPNTIEFAILLDPHGAMFNIMRPLRDGETPKFAPGTPGTMGWNELHAGNWNDAWTFYHGLFDWEKHQSLDMGAQIGIYQIFGLEGVSFGAMMTKRPEMPRPYWNYYWNVDSIKAAVTRLTAAGGQVRFGPMQVPGGSWIVNATDPQGGMFALTSLNK
jgi:uncharacterized protein